jgi:acetoin utilization protein AcuB
MNAIRDFMTRSPHAIGHDQPLKLAHQRMHQHGIRHLPVLDGGVLVGVLSERDIALAGAISPQHAAETTVEEAMSTEPYAVPPDTDAEIVTAHMVEHKSGCAVVMEHKKVVGVFSNLDALSLLTSLLQEFKDSDTLSKHVRSAQRPITPRPAPTPPREPVASAVRAEKPARATRGADGGAKRAERVAKVAKKTARAARPAKATRVTKAARTKVGTKVSTKVGRAAAARTTASKARSGKRK